MQFVGTVFLIVCYFRAPAGHFAVAHTPELGSSKNRHTFSFVVRFSCP